MSYYSKILQRVMVSTETERRPCSSLDSEKQGCIFTQSSDNELRTPQFEFQADRVGRAPEHACAMVFRFYDASTYTLLLVRSLSKWRCYRYDSYFLVVFISIGLQSG